MCVCSGVFAHARLSAPSFGAPSFRQAKKVDAAPHGDAMATLPRLVVPPGASGAAPLDDGVVKSPKQLRKSGELSSPKSKGSRIKKRPSAPATPSPVVDQEVSDRQTDGRTSDDAARRFAWRCAR